MIPSPDAGGERPPSPGRGEPDRPEFPVGTVTILMTDIEGSTRLRETEPAATEVALNQHDRLLIRSSASRRRWQSSVSGPVNAGSSSEG